MIHIIISEWFLPHDLQFSNCLINWNTTQLPPAANERQLCFECCSLEGSGKCKGTFTFFHILPLWTWPSGSPLAVHPSRGIQYGILLGCSPHEKSGLNSPWSCCLFLHPHKVTVLFNVLSWFVNTGHWGRAWFCLCSKRSLLWQCFPVGSTAWRLRLDTGWWDGAYRCRWRSWACCYPRTEGGRGCQSFLSMLICP